MKKVSIVTIQNSSNYGAMLQAYALQEYLLKLELDVEIVNYDNRFMSKGLDCIRHGLSMVDIYYSIIDFINMKARRKMIKNFKEFSKNRLRLGELTTEKELLSGHYPKRDVFISGSDQIWNPNVTNGKVDSVYYCKMSGLDSKVISYASSVGGYDFKNVRFNQQIAENLTKYSAITTRESNYIPQLEKLINRTIKQVMDPVFLLDAEDWKKFVNEKYQVSKPYILIYAMAAHERIIDSVKKAYSDTEYELVIIYEPLLKKKGIHYIVDAGPEEFVSLFYNADIIITNSFHGMAFGLIFNKKMKVINNARNMNRIYDLLISVDAKKALVQESDDLNSAFNLDYEIINRKLVELISKSKEYLEGELL